LRSAFRALSLGVGLLVFSLALEQVGAHMQSLPILVLSLSFGIAGAVVCFKGLIDLLTEVV
jgi:hypothetical protein